MLQTPQELRAKTHELSHAIWTLAALGVLFESGLAERLREPASVAELATRLPQLSAARIEHCLAVAVAVGAVVAEGERFRLAPGVVPFSQPPLRATVEGEVRGTLLQAVAFLDDSGAPRWRHTDRKLLQAQGDASSGFVPILKNAIVPSLGDLARRLEAPEARFLDVGVGVASLAIAVCRAFPQVHVTGVDAYEAPLAIARENVARAGLAARIELVQGAIEKLDYERAFDLAWLPTFFIDEAVLPAATAKVHAALRPGGFILFPTGTSPTASAEQAAVYGLVNHLWGGPSLTVDRGESVLRDAGFTGVRPLPGPAWAPAMLVGQRAG